MDTVVYGAQGYALGAYKALRYLHPEMQIPCFVVSKMGNNASVLADIPVVEIGSFAGEKTMEERDNIRVLIATPENTHSEIEETLERYGFHDHQRITSERWSELMTSYYTQTGHFLPLETLSSGNIEPSVNIFVAKFHKDKELNNYPKLDKRYEYIQVGTAGTDIKIADIQDDLEDNISEKNGNYSELTGLYWIWKNVLCKGSSDDAMNSYYGFAQYRRILMLDDNDFTRLVKNDIDVVLPYPLMYEPNINAHHERYIKKADWDSLLLALSELQPEYAECFPRVLEQQYLYNYNVILAKKSVLKDYCAWLFPVLAKTEELSVPRGIERSDRYIGYMGEMLETLYFMINRERLNIAHTGCKLYA